MKFGLNGVCGLSTILKESLLTSLGGARRKPKWRNCFAQIGLCRAAKTPAYSGHWNSFFDYGLGMKLLWNIIAMRVLLILLSYHFWPLLSPLPLLPLPVMLFLDYNVWGPARHSHSKIEKSRFSSQVMAKLEWALVTEFLSNWEFRAVSSSLKWQCQTLMAGLWEIKRQAIRGTEMVFSKSHLKKSKVPAINYFCGKQSVFYSLRSFSCYKLRE